MAGPNISTLTDLKTEELKKNITGSAKKVTFASWLFILICIGCFVLQRVSDEEISARFCGNDWSVVNHLQIYRLWTGYFLHMNVLHLVLSLLSLWFGGAYLENHYGTFPFILLSLTLMMMSSLVHLGIAFALHTFDFSSWDYLSGLVGLSGYLFALMQIVFAGIKKDLKMPYCGFPIPAPLIPWILLGIVQLFPRVSFLGHLSGIIAGQLFNWRLLRLILPGEACLRVLDAKIGCIGKCGFVMTSTEVTSSGRFGAGCCGGGLAAKAGQKFQEFKDQAQI